MSDRRLRRWVGLGALASVVLLGGACQRGGESNIEERGGPSGIPEAGRQNEGRANESQDIESFGEQPGTGGAGQQQQPQPQPGQPMQQGGQPNIGAPGYTTPQETGTPGTGVTGGDTATMGGGTSAPGTNTESGGIQPQTEPQSDEPGSDLSPGTPLGE